MNIEVSPAEQVKLIELLESHARDLHPLIRRSRVSAATDELKRELVDVERLLEKVRGATGES
jgi:hypothetical protein